MTQRKSSSSNWYKPFQAAIETPQGDSLPPMDSFVLRTWSLFGSYKGPFHNSMPRGRQQHSYWKPTVLTSPPSEPVLNTYSSYSVHCHLHVCAIWIVPPFQWSTDRMGGFNAHQTTYRWRLWVAAWHKITGLRNDCIISSCIFWSTDPDNL